MPKFASYLDLPKVKKPALWTFFWAAVFFALINVAVFVVFDLKYFEVIGHKQLLSYAFDNEIQSMIHKIRNEEEPQLIMLGDSTMWGASLDDVSDTTAARLGAINLASPGNSLLDMYATIEAIDNNDNTYLFVINPNMFEAYYADRPFEDLIRYPRLVTRTMQVERTRLDSCCSVRIPERDILEESVESAFFRFLPLYRNRELIMKKAIRVPPHIAINVIINNMIDTWFGLRERPKKHVDPEITKKTSGLYSAEDFTDTRMIRALSVLSELHRVRPNIHYVILGENRYERNFQRIHNYRVIHDAIRNKESVLDLHTKFQPDMYLDTTHMNPAGHAVAAEEIASYLSLQNAP